MHRAAVLRLLAVAALLAAGGVRAEDGPAWNTLTGPQKQVLAPLQGSWGGIDAERKQKWLEVARRFPNMPEPERQRIQTRMDEWARMTPAERGNARLRFRESRQLSPEDRRERWEAYQALPDDQRRALANRAQRAAPAPSVARPPEAGEPKRNVVMPGRQGAVKPVAPTVVQARPGATTTLMNKPQGTPAHQQPGLPKIAATEGFVDRDTLLPRRGPQGAAAQPPARDERKSPRQ